MILDKNRVYDGWDNLAAGMDAGRRPSLIDGNQCAVARDVVFRGGVPKSRPGIKKLTLEHEEQLYYGPAGTQLGPGTVHDAIFDDNFMSSQTAMFTASDIGSVIISSGVPLGTKITDILTEATVVTDSGAIPTAVFVDATIVSRSNPVTFVGGSDLYQVISLLANFNVADVGHPITGGMLPPGTYITQVISPTIARVNSFVATETDITYTMPDRVANLSSAEAFATEPFQCARYYAPQGLGECIMATFGGRLFQITPGVDTARVREIPVQEAAETTEGVRSFDDGAIITNGSATITNTLAAVASDVGARVTSIEPGVIPRDTFISAVNTGANTMTLVTARGGTTPATISSSSTGVAIWGFPKPVFRRNRRTIPENWMVQADRFHITQDGESKPIIFDGVKARRAAEDEVIVGTIMAYGLGRLVLVRGRDIFFGDLFGSHPGDPSDSVLKFTETNFLSEGFPASIPYVLGDVTAASFYPQQDTATGQGPLIIFTDRGAVTFDLSLERTEWKKSAFQQIALINSTARGNRAVVSFNGDLWVRSDEGWRPYRQARAQVTGWSQLPMSTEVTPWIKADTSQLLRFGSGINFDNRLLGTCNPVPNQGRPYHDGILALDFDVLSSFGQASKPAWDGHWGKLKTLQLVSGTFRNKPRAFALGLDENNETQVYEITTNDRRDWDGPITSEIEFRSHNFNAPFNEKNLYGADVWVDEVAEPVTMDLSFRPDSYQEYLPWKTFNEINPPGECGNITCGMCPTIGQGFAPRQKVPKPSDNCEEQTGRLIRRGFEFQPKLRWTGHAAIRRMRLHAMQEEEDPKATC